MNALEFQNVLSSARQSLQAGDFQKALTQYEQVLREGSRSGVVWYEYGNAARQLRRFKLADEAWTRACALEPGNSELVGLIGHQYQSLRLPAKAMKCFAQAAAVDPRGINPRISLAVLHEKTHQLEESRAVVEDCLRIDPRDEQARYFTAVLDRREGRLETAETGLRDLLTSDPRHAYVRYATRYELAQILDQTGRFDEAMQQLSAAKEIVRALTNADLLLRSYDQSAHSAHQFTSSQPKDILKTWATYFPERKRCAIPRLAFLGGHPRSGTTLLEQVLDAHPQVAALDEPAAFLDVLQPAFHQSTHLSSPRVNVLRQLYVDALQQELGEPIDGRVLIDKNPSPTSRLPIWLRVFPELKVLIALRDPRDVLLSCYFQNIPLNATNVNFLSLERIARHYSDLMSIWLLVREWEGFAWQETRYEDLVSDLPAEGGRVTKFLGLDWHESQARFHEKSRQKQLYSPTYQDVTRPVYTRSVARWLQYEKHLAPFFPVLEPFCQKFGYR